MSEETKKVKTKESEEKDTSARKEKIEEPKENTGIQLSEGGASPLIGGGGLLSMLHETLLPIIEHLKNRGIEDDDDEEDGDMVEECPFKPETPFDVIKDEDFDDGDPTVQRFKGKGGTHGIVEIVKIGNPGKMIDKLAELVDDLTSFRTAARQGLLRQVFSNIYAARKGDKNSQRSASLILSRLALDSQDFKERYALIKSYRAVYSGADDQYDAAAFRVKSLFAKNLPVEDNIRVAYTSLSTQAGEGYLICPKAQHNIGYAMPIEVSKCREQCIDSHVTHDGKVSCQFHKWLKTSADNQEAAMSRFDVQRHPDNAANLLTLQPGDKSNPGHIDAEYDNYEHLMDAANSRTPKTYAKSKINEDTSFEDRLHKANGLAKPQKVSDTEHSAVYGNQPDKTLTDKENKSTISGSRISAAQNHKIDPNKLETIEEQIEESQDEKNVPTSLIENRLDKNGLYNHKGEEQKRMQDLFSKKASFGSDKIDYTSEDSMGKQIDDSHSKTPNLDQTTEDLLEEEDNGWPDEDYELLIEQLLAKKREENK